jgi:hypothetical protein
MAPLAIPVTLPKSAVRNETILSDSPNGRERNTMAGVTWLERIIELATKGRQGLYHFFMKPDNYLKYQEFSG